MKISRTKFVRIVMLFVLIFSALPVNAQGGDLQLTVLHTNDVHGRVDEFDKYGNSCDEEEKAENKCFGGAARLQTMINRNCSGTCQNHLPGSYESVYGAKTTCKWRNYCQKKWFCSFLEG